MRVQTLVALSAGLAVFKLKSIQEKSIKISS